MQQIYRTIKINVRTNKKESRLIFVNENELIAELRSRPIDNKANLELLSLLSLHFQVDKNMIDIKGLRSRVKYIKIKSSN